MTVEFTMLIWATLLCLALPLVYVPLYGKQVGFKALFFNRDTDTPKPEGMAARGLRAHMNLIENLVPFAVLIILAHITGVSNQMTVLGAELFLAARVFHAISYIFGVPYLRTLCYALGVAGMVMIVIPIFRFA